MQHFRETAIITSDFKAYLKSLLALLHVPACHLGTIILDGFIFEILEQLQLTLQLNCKLIKNICLGEKKRQKLLTCIIF